MTDETFIRAPLVISDAGVMTTFGCLVAREVAERYRALPDQFSLRPSVAHLCLYLGLRHTAEELGLPKGNIWIYPDERHEHTFANVLEGSDEVPLVYISVPSTKDPDFLRRHPGPATFFEGTFLFSERLRLCRLTVSQGAPDPRDMQHQT